MKRGTLGARGARKQAKSKRVRRGGNGGDRQSTRAARTNPLSVSGSSTPPSHVVLLGRLAEGLRAGLAPADSAHRILYCNLALQDVFGRRFGLGKRLEDMAAPRSRGGIAAAFSQAEWGTAQGKLAILTETGELRTMVFSVG